MKHAALLALLLSSVSFAQTATLAVPEVTPNRTTLIVGEIREVRADPNSAISSASITVVLWKLDALGKRVEERPILLTANAEIQGFLAAIETPLSGEQSGTTLAARARRHNARVLAYVIGNCATFLQPCQAQFSTATVVP